MPWSSATTRIARCTEKAGDSSTQVWACHWWCQHTTSFYLDLRSTIPARRLYPGQLEPSRHDVTGHNGVDVGQPWGRWPPTVARKLVWFAGSSSVFKDACEPLDKIKQNCGWENIRKLSTAQGLCSGTWCACWKNPRSPSSTRQKTSIRLSNKIPNKTQYTTTPRGETSNRRPNWSYETRTTT